MRVIQTYRDGSFHADIDGVTVSCGPRGAVFSLTDWSVTKNWESKGILERSPGSPSTYGHDTYRLSLEAMHELGKA